MTDIDDVLRSALHDAVPEPPTYLDPATIRSATAAARSLQGGRTGLLGHYPGYQTLLGVAASILLIAGLAVGMTVGLSSPRPSQQSPASQTPGHAAPVTPDSPRARTARVVARLLAQAPTYPASSPAAMPPNELLAEGPGFANPNGVDRHSFATGEGTVRDVLSYYRRQLGDGYQLALETPSSTSGGTSTEADYAVTEQRRLATDVYRELQLAITASPLGSGKVGIRLDAYAVWIPPRPSGTTLPVVTRSATVTQWHNKSVHRRLTPDQATTLIKLINRLPVLTPEHNVHACVYPYVDTVVFKFPHLTVGVTAGGRCQTLDLVRNAHPLPVTFPSSAFDKALGQLVR